MGNDELPKAGKEKYVEIIIQNYFSPDGHTYKLFGESRALLSNFLMLFDFMNESVMKKIMTAIFRPRIEYAAITWSLHLRKHTRKIERVQRTPTKMISGPEEME